MRFINIPLADIDSVSVPRTRMAVFSRLPDARMNRGRIQPPTGYGSPTPPPVDDILTIGGDALQDGGVDLKNG